MKKIRSRLSVFLMALALAACQAKASDFPSETVVYSQGGSPMVLRGLIYKPNGTGPFPAVLFNHGSAPGMLNTMAFDMLGPMFAAHGWIFFAPYRRGQGLSEVAGPNIVDEIAAAQSRGGAPAAADTLVRLLATDHLDDQTAAFNWLSRQPFVQVDRIAVMGNSFGGIESLFGAERLPYCAAIDASGGAESWAKAPALRESMAGTARKILIPVFFFQARNDYDIAPSVTLNEVMHSAGKTAELRLYPAFGSTERDGHSFAYRGASIWFPDVFAFVEQNCGERGAQ